MDGKWIRVDYVQNSKETAHENHEYVNTWFLLATVCLPQDQLKLEWEEKALQDQPLLRRNVEANRQGDVAVMQCWQWRQLRIKLSWRQYFAIFKEF